MEYNIIYLTKSNYLVILFFLFYSSILKAQDPCTNWMKGVNGSNLFPTERETEYFDCLKKNETLYSKILSDQLELSQSINKQNNALNTKRTSLQIAISSRDSVKIIQYNREVDSISNIVKSLDSGMAKLNGQITESRNILIASYERVIKYFKNEDPVGGAIDRSKEYSDKRDKLKRVQ